MRCVDVKPGAEDAVTCEQRPEGGCKGFSGGFAFQCTGASDGREAHQGQASRPIAAPAGSQPTAAPARPQTSDAACTQTCLKKCEDNYNLTDPRYLQCKNFCVCENGQLREVNPYLNATPTPTPNRPALNPAMQRRLDELKKRALGRPDPTREILDRNLQAIRNRQQELTTEFNLRERAANAVEPAPAQPSVDDEKPQRPRAAQRPTSQPRAPSINYCNGPENGNRALNPGCICRSGQYSSSNQSTATMCL
jgi:hypothetical protein